MSDPLHGPAAAQAAHLAKTLAGLRDPSIQVGWLRSQLLSLGAARATDVLTVVLARAEQREERYASLLLRVSIALATPENARFKRAVARLADVRGQRALGRFLGTDGVVEDHEAPDFEGIDGDDPAKSVRKGRVPDFGKGRPLTLGERKSIARSRDKALLDRVLRDPHPDVIRILLDNPAIVEDDVVRLAALRPVPPEVLVQVFRHTRWIIRYRVRHALARNPHTPEDVAVQLVPHLTPSDRRELAHVSHASERLRAACMDDSQNQKPLH
jgi:hypothetical protein